MIRTAAGQSFDSAGTVTATSGNSSSPINLWLVDDNHRIRRTIAEILSNCDGINCTASFCSPNEVLSKLASKVGPDVILLDIHMGDHNGLDTIRPIKSLSRSTRVLMFTTFFDSESESRAKADGASGFLLKTFPLQKILTAIRHAYDQPSPHPKMISSQRATIHPTQTNTLHPQKRGVTLPSPDNQLTSKTAKRSLWMEQCLELFRGIRK